MIAKTKNLPLWCRPDLLKTVADGTGKRNQTLRLIKNTSSELSVW
jgi:hypothetical protein